MKLQPDWRIIWPHLGSLLAATHDEPVRKKDSREPVYSSSKDYERKLLLEPIMARNRDSIHGPQTAAAHSWELAAGQ